MSPMPMRAAMVAALIQGGAALAQSAAPPAAADERAGLEALRETTLSLIQALVDQGLLTRARADALIRQAQAPRGEASAATTDGGAAVISAARPAAAANAATVRVPFVPEAVKNQIRDEVREEVLASVRSEAQPVPSAAIDWLKRITIAGDVRWRGERDAFDSDNLPPEFYRAQTDSPAWAPDLTNTLVTRDRQTVRARIGAVGQVSDSVSAGARLSTGNGPSSGSQTLGNDYNRFNATFDRAWVRWQPFDGFSIDAGRIENPFVSTDLLWPEDLSPDGVALRYEHPVGDEVQAFALAVASPLEEITTSRSDKWLYAGQVGARWKPSDAFEIRGAVAYYDFHDIEGVRETELPPTGALAGTTSYFSTQYPASARQKGNTLINLNAPGSTAAPTWGLASKFRPWDATVGATWLVAPGWQAGLNLDYVKNTAFDTKDIERRAGTPTVADLAERTTGAQARATVGTPTLANPGDWQVTAAYRKFERDAWIDAFTDPNWHLGGTSYKGFQIGASYAIDRRAVLGFRWTSTQNLDDGKRFLAIPGDPSSLSGDLSSAPLKIDVLQLDATVRF